MTRIPNAPKPPQKTGTKPPASSAGNRNAKPPEKAREPPAPPSEATLPSEPTGPSARQFPGTEAAFETELSLLRTDILTRPATLAKIRRTYRYRQNQRLELTQTIRKMEQNMSQNVDFEFLKTKSPQLSNADKRRRETGWRLEEMPEYQNLVNQREKLQTAIYTLEDDLAAGRETLRAEIAVLTSLNPAPVIVTMAPGERPKPTPEMKNGGSQKPTPGGCPCEP